MPKITIKNYQQFPRVSPREGEPFLKKRKWGTSSCLSPQLAIICVFSPKPLEEWVKEEEEKEAKDSEEEEEGRQENIYKSKQTRGQGGEGERGTWKNIYKRKQRRRIMNRRKKGTKEYIEKWTCALCGRWCVTCAGGRVSEGKSGAKYGSVSSDIDTGHVPPKWLCAFVVFLFRFCCCFFITF